MTATSPPKAPPRSSSAALNSSGVPFSGGIDGRAVLEDDDIAHRIAAGMDRFRTCPGVLTNDGRAVLGLHHGDRDALSKGLDRPALVEADQPLARHDAQQAKCLAHIGIHRDLGPGHFRQLCRVADMIAMAVGDQDQIDRGDHGQVLQRLRRLRIAGDEGVDQDDLAPRRDDLEGGLPVPLDLNPLARAEADQKRRDGAKSARIM